MSCDATTIYLENFHETFNDALETFIEDPIKGKNIILELYRYDVEEAGSLGFDQLDELHKDLILHWLKEDR